MVQKSMTLSAISLYVFMKVKVQLVPLATYILPQLLTLTLMSIHASHPRQYSDQQTVEGRFPQHCEALIEEARATEKRKRG